MRAEHIQDWQFSAAQAADILGWSERRFANWTKRYQPFPHKKQGRGYSISYGLSDLMKLAEAGHLVALGLSPEKAFAAVAPYAGPYGALLHNPVGHDPYPGTTTYTQVNGRWVGLDTPDAVTAIKVRAWPIFDEIFPRVKDAILNSPRACEIAELRAAVKEYENKIDEIRKERWGFPGASDLAAGS
jgi:hypothetical protein